MLPTAKVMHSLGSFELLEFSRKGMGKCFRNDGSIIDPALGSSAIRAVQWPPQAPWSSLLLWFYAVCGEKKCFGQSSSSISLRQSVLFRKHASVPYSSTGITSQGFIAVFSVIIIVFDKKFHPRVPLNLLLYDERPVCGLIHRLDSTL